MGLVGMVAPCNFLSLLDPLSSLPHLLLFDILLSVYTSSWILVGVLKVIWSAPTHPLLFQLGSFPLNSFLPDDTPVG
jgi:hypothetical protein